MRGDTTTTRGSQTLALLTTFLLCAPPLVAGNSSNTLNNASHASHSMGTSPATLLQRFASQPQPTCISAKKPETIRDRLDEKATTSFQSGQSLQPTGDVDPVALINSVISSTTSKNQPTISHSSPHTSAPTDTGTQIEASQETDDAFSDASFLSFEDWKKQILEKDKNAATKDEMQRRPQERQETLDSLGDDHEIDIDFGALFGDKKDQKKQQHTKDEVKAAKKQNHQDQQNEVAKAEAHKYRSKDAGKTCKERTNFASFDSGAQIMKTNKEAQSASQILSENKDRYMLNTCSAKNKFLIVELSDSILVDTVALANFEFFSSTFRQFRLSVSDQYPVKLDKWVDLGTFEAKNTREIQAFRVEDPRIWARYLRIEFLSQYGSEFYCPVSLLRVHGRTMIQDILSQEQGPIPEDEQEVEQEKTPLKEEVGETMIPEAVADIVEEEERVTEGLKEAQAALADLVKTAENITGEHSKTLVEPVRIEEVKHLLEDASMKLLSSPWSRTRDLENLFNEVKRLNQCYPWEHELDNLTSQSLSNTTEPPENKTADLPITPTEHVVLPDATISPTPTRDARKPTMGQNVTTSATPTITPSPVIDRLLESLISGPEYSSSSASSSSSSSTSSPLSSPIVLSASSVVSSLASVVKNATSIIIPAAQNATSPVSTNRTTSTSSHSAQPTTQESFFKNVSKRLANLESDSSLSLKYIEEQSRSLREAFNKAEKRQAQKVTAFLENLNGTVIPQMKGYQQMYETIWKSTVTELEGQRDLLKGETEAMGERLKLLADELVFQKRMAIGQSVLLLLCLGLVLFGRYLPGGIEVWRHHAEDIRQHHDHGIDGMQFDVDSGLSSPEQNRSPAASPGPRRPWSGKNLPARPVGRRTHSNMSQRSHPGVERPPTPFSDYAEVEAPSPRQAYVQAEMTGNLNDSTEPRQPFDNSEVIEGVGRRLPGDELPPKRLVDEILQNMAAENSDPSIIRKQLEEAVDKELLPAFSGTPHYSQSQRHPATRSNSGGSPQMVNGTGRTQHPNQHMNSLENSWTEAGTSPEQSRRQSRRPSQSAQGGYESDGGRSAGRGGPQIRITPEAPRGQRRSDSMPGSGSQTAGSGGSAQGSPEQPRRFSIARKPLPALPPGEGNKF